MIVSSNKAAEAASVLGVELAGLTASAVTGAYHAKAKLCHPDYHGDSELQVWARVSWAKECLGHWLKQQPTERESELNYGDCRICSGTGRVAVRRRGFGAPMTMACTICKGLGSVIPEENDHD